MVRTGQSVTRGSGSGGIGVVSGNWGLKEWCTADCARMGSNILECTFHFRTKIYNVKLVKKKTINRTRVINYQAS